MRHCFPSWSDIRKRTKKSMGGSLLRAYAEEHGRLDEALEDYKKIFFLVNYEGHEDEFPDHLYAATIGDVDLDDLSVDSFVCSVTEEEPEFLADMEHTALKAGAYLLFHESILPKDTESVLYSVDSSQYRADLIRIPIWNAFDEFAKFAGIERFDGETNKELEARTYAVFKDFPNPTQEGLKRAIRDALIPVADIDESEISIYPIDETLDLSDSEIADIYEQFIQFNRDLFRAKIWNIDNWENGFQKQSWIPHPWDKPMAITQDGVGGNESLKVSYLRDLDTTGLTDVEVSAYKRDFETIRRYVTKHPVEDTIELTLTKYGDKISPMKIGYAIRAYDVKKIEHPENVRIRVTKTSTGVKHVYLEDAAQELEGVEVEKRGLLDSDTDYVLRFVPKGDFSSMSVHKCVLSDGNDEKDIREEKGQYKLLDGDIVNSFVRAHITETSQLVRNDNMVDIIEGMTLGKNKATGSFDIDVHGMENELISWKASCRESSIMNTSYITMAGGFEYDREDNAYKDDLLDSLGTLVIGGEGNEMTCNSFSIGFADAPSGAKKGAAYVTVTADGKTEKLSVRSGGRIERSYEKRVQVRIEIQKYGQYPIAVNGIRMSSYDVEVSMSDGSPMNRLGTTVRLPAKIADDAVLHVNIKPYISANPVIEYVHVGGSIKGACYELRFSTHGMKDPELDIDSDCGVSLYKDEEDTLKLVAENYKTKDVYTNPYHEDGTVVLDLTKFTSISDSEPQIESKYLGGTKTYVTLHPGESLDEIVVTGSMTEFVSDKSLLDCFSGESTCDFYTTKAGKGIVLDSREKDGISLQYIPSEVIGKGDVIQVTGLPSGIKASLLYRDGSMQEITGPSFTTNFKSLVLSYENAKEYVAYNSASIISEKTSDIKMVNTFQPVLSMTELHLYEIEKPSNTEHETSIKFMGTQSAFSLGADDAIEIDTDEDFKNKSRWPLEVRRIIDRCIISNEILLDDRYLVDGSYHELSEYIIEAPKGLEIGYEESDAYAEAVTIPATGVQKLRYSNIIEASIKLDGVPLKSGYHVMEDEGIILWGSEHVGKAAEIVYKVRRPSSITYTSEYEDKLYELVDNNADALKFVGSKKFEQAKDQDIFQTGFQDADLVVTKCSNPAFTSVSSNGLVRVVQIRDDDHIAVKSGYIYDAGREYYRFNETHHEDVEQAESIEFHNVSRQGDDMLFHMKSRNFLPDSNMKSDAMTTLCRFDFTKEGVVRGVSSFGHLTSCDSYNLWYLVNMQAGLAASNGNTCISFSSEGGTGYAALDITGYAKDGYILSLLVKGRLEAFLVKEAMVDGMPFTKSVFIDMGKAEAFEEKDGLLVGKLKTPAEDGKLYLVLSGTDGTVDDIVISESKKSFGGLHEKNIDRLGFSISEKLPKRYECDLEFTRDGASYEDAVCSSDGTVTTSTSVEYGLTKAGDVVLTDCLIHNADYKNGKITAVRDDAIVQTKAVYVRGSSSAYAIYVKVNSILGNNRKGFDIEVYTSSQPGTGFTLAAEESETNLVTVKKENVKSYVYAVVKARSGKVIDSVEIYVRYAEAENAPLVSVPKESGRFTSKIYDLGIKGSYTFKGMDADIEEVDGSIECQARGIRKNDDAMVFTEWKDEGEAFEDCSMFQFRINVKGEGASARCRAFRMVAN